MNGRTTPDVPPRLIEFFQREATECVERLENATSGIDPDPLELLAAARTLRGSATMARLTALAVLAGRLERTARAIQLDRDAWTDGVADAVRRAVSDLRRLVDAAANWSAAEEDLAHERTRELTDRATPARARAADDAIVPIAKLFHDDSGPHVVYVAVTPQTQFEQQLVALAARHTPATPAFAIEPVVDLRADRRTPSAAARALAWRPAEPPPQRAPEAPARPEAEARPPRGGGPRGSELRALLQQSVSTLSASFSGRGDEVVPIDALLYRGQAALDRARQISVVLRERGTPVAPDDFAELLDLIELAGRG